MLFSGELLLKIIMLIIKSFEDYIFVYKFNSKKVEIIFYISGYVVFEKILNMSVRFFYYEFIFVIVF